MKWWRCVWHGLDLDNVEDVTDRAPEGAQAKCYDADETHTRPSHACFVRTSDSASIEQAVAAARENHPTWRPS